MKRFRLPRMTGSRLGLPCLPCLPCLGALLALLALLARPSDQPGPLDPVLLATAFATLTRQRANSNG